MIGTPQYLKQVKGVTNTAFELECILQKIEQAPSSLIPILREGNFDTSFPDYIQKNFHPLDLKYDDQYIDKLIGIKPRGLLSSMLLSQFSHLTDKIYGKLLQSFHEKPLN